MRRCESLAYAFEIAGAFRGFGGTVTLLFDTIKFKNGLWGLWDFDSIGPFLF